MISISLRMSRMELGPVSLRLLICLHAYLLPAASVTTWITPNCPLLICCPNLNTCSSGVVNKVPELYVYDLDATSWLAGCNGPALRA